MENYTYVSLKEARYLYISFDRVYVCYGRKYRGEDHNSGFTDISISITKPEDLAVTQFRLEVLNHPNWIECAKDYFINLDYITKIKKVRPEEYDIIFVNFNIKEPHSFTKTLYVNQCEEESFRNGILNFKKNNFGIISH